MSVRASRSQLATLTRDLMNHWEQTKSQWRDTPSQEFAAGGVVRPIYAASGFAPRGTDTVPAMLTPGERVLTVAQNRAYERGTVAPLPASVRPLQITVISQIGRREFARSVVNLSPNEFELAGL